MHPFENEKPNIPYHLLGEQHLLYDCIYNPERTLFLQEGELQRCTLKNGLEMLHQQADEAKIIFEL
jgi:shikimate dehydrogenase